MFLWFLGASAPAEVDEPRSLQSRTGRIVEVPYIPQVLDAETQRKVLKDKRDREFIKRIKHTQKSIEADEIKEIIRETDNAAVEMQLLDHIKEEQNKEELRLFLLDTIEQRYQESVEKICTLTSLIEAQELLCDLYCRIRIFLKHDSDKRARCHEVIKRFHEQVCTIQMPAKYYVFSDLFDTSEFDEFKLLTISLLEPELITKVVQFMIQREPPLYKESVLSLVRDRLPPDVLEALAKWDMEKSKKSFWGRIQEKWTDMVTRGSNDD